MLNIMCGFDALYDANARYILCLTSPRDTVARVLSVPIIVSFKISAELHYSQVHGLPVRRAGPMARKSAT